MGLIIMLIVLQGAVAGHSIQNDQLHTVTHLIQIVVISSTTCLSSGGSAYAPSYMYFYQLIGGLYNTTDKYNLYI